MFNKLKHAPVLIQLPENNNRSKFHQWNISHDTVLNSIYDLLDQYTKQKKRLISLCYKPEQVLLPHGPKAFFYAQISNPTKVYQRVYDNIGHELSIKHAINECDNIIKEYQMALNLFLENYECGYPFQEDVWENDNLVLNSLATGKLITEEDLLRFWDQRFENEQTQVVEDVREIQESCHNEFNKEIEFQRYEDYYWQGTVPYYPNDLVFTWKVEDCFSALKDSVYILKYPFENNQCDFNKFKTIGRKKLKFNPYIRDQKFKFRNENSLRNDSTCRMKPSEYNILGEYKNLFQDLYDCRDNNWYFTNNSSSHWKSSNVYDLNVFSESIILPKSLVQTSLNANYCKNINFLQDENQVPTKIEERVLDNKSKTNENLDYTENGNKIIENEENNDDSSLALTNNAKSVVDVNSNKIEKKLNPAQLKIIQLINSKAGLKNKINMAPTPKIMPDAAVMKKTTPVTLGKYEIVCSHDKNYCGSTKNVVSNYYRENPNGLKNQKILSRKNDPKPNKHLIYQNRNVEFNHRSVRDNICSDATSYNNFLLPSKTSNGEIFTKQAFKNNANHASGTYGNSWRHYRKHNNKNNMDFQYQQKLKVKEKLISSDHKGKSGEHLKQTTTTNNPISHQQKIIEHLHQDFLKSIDQDTAVYYDSTQQKPSLISNEQCSQFGSQTQTENLNKNMNIKDGSLSIENCKDEVKMHRTEDMLRVTNIKNQVIVNNNQLGFSEKEIISYQIKQDDKYNKLIIKEDELLKQTEKHDETKLKQIADTFNNIVENVPQKYSSSKKRKVSRKTTKKSSILVTSIKKRDKNKTLSTKNTKCNSKNDEKKVAIEKSKEIQKNDENVIGKKSVLNTEKEMLDTLSNISQGHKKDVETENPVKTTTQLTIPQKNSSTTKETIKNNFNNQNDTRIHSKEKKKLKKRKRSKKTQNKDNTSAKNNDDNDWSNIEQTKMSDIDQTSNDCVSIDKTEPNEVIKPTNPYNRMLNKLKLQNKINEIKQKINENNEKRKKQFKRAKPIIKIEETIILKQPSYEAEKRYDTCNLSTYNETDTIPTNIQMFYFVKTKKDLKKMLKKIREFQDIHTETTLDSEIEIGSYESSESKACNDLLSLSSNLSYDCENVADINFEDQQLIEYNIVESDMDDLYNLDNVKPNSYDVLPKPLKFRKNCITEFLDLSLLALESFSIDVV